MWFRLSGGGGASGGNTSTGNSDQSSGRSSGGSSEGDAATTANSSTTSSHISSELTSAATVTNGNEMPNGGKPARSARETSKFEKFRRASFRRKSSSTAANNNTGSRKRSKSPHAILQADKSFSSLEEEANEDDQMVVTDIKEKTAALKLLLAATSNNKNNNNNGGGGDDDDDNDKNTKVPLKPIKTDPPKRKFYKFASMRRQNSDDKRSSSVENDVTDGDMTKVSSKTMFKKLPIIDDTAADSGNNEEKSETIASTDDDDNDDDDDDDNDDDVKVDDDDEEDNEKKDEVSDKDKKCKKGKKQKNMQKKDTKERCKEKIFLTDPKFKHNRIEKSSSKTKISNGHGGTVAGDKLEKRESIKRSRSARKISAPPILVDENKTSGNNISNNNNNNNGNNSSSKKVNKKAEKEPPRSRAHSTHLNLQALVKLMVSNKKFLNTDDFALIRRKSISEAASTMIAVAACKPLPIALKYTPENVVAEAPKEYDAKGERNVVLVKKQNLTNSFCDQLNNNNNNINNNDNKTSSFNSNNNSGDNAVRVRKSVDKDLLKKGGVIKTTDMCTKVKRNSSNSSKSSGNFEDEAFYSCDELEAERMKNGLVDDKIDEEQQQKEQKLLNNIDKDDNIKRKSSSPSLTSRVAAKINETTNIYKNRKAAKSAKKRKAQANATEKRPELYKQISVGKKFT